MINSYQINLRHYEGEGALYIAEVPELEGYLPGYGNTISETLDDVRAWIEGYITTIPDLLNEKLPNPLNKQELIQLNRHYSEKEVADCQAAVKAFRFPCPSGT